MTMKMPQISSERVIEPVFSSATDRPFESATKHGPRDPEVAAVLAADREKFIAEWLGVMNADHA